MTSQADSVSQDLPSEEVLASVDNGQKLRLPFSFAKRFGAVLVWEGENPILHVREGVTIATLHEVKRFTRVQFAIQEHPKEAFDLLLGKAYQRDSSGQPWNGQLRRNG